MKKIALYDIDGRIPNLALMKLSAYHKQQGNQVEFYTPLFHSIYDKIYASKLFKYPHPNDGYIRNDMIKGGPGFNIHTKLPKDIDHIYPDYTLYNCNYAMGYITKGCPRNCKWCIVPKMEGNIHKFAELEEFCKNQKKIRLLDNNILAYESHMEELQKLYDTKKRFDFTQGLDIRLINKENAELIREIKCWKGLRYKFAFDDPGLKKIIENKLKLLFNSGFTSGILQFYILIGFNTTFKQDLMRVKFLATKGIDVFAMPFNKLDPYQKHFARWVNRHLYRKCSFKEYISNKEILSDTVPLQFLKSENKTIKFNYEIEFIDFFCEFLETNNIEYKRELNPGFPYHKSKIDIVIRENNDLIGIEAKIKDFEAVFRQTLGNRVFTPYNCVLFPVKPSEEKSNELKHNGIGLYIYDFKLNTFICLWPSIKSEFTSQRFYNKLKKNWNLNKCGRLFNKSELPPENYELKDMYSKNWNNINLEV